MIHDLHERFVNKHTSVTETVSSYLQRIEKKDTLLNAFISVDRKGAIKRATDLDKILKSSSNDILREYPLFGIPIAHKDIYSTSGIQTTAGSAILKGYIPPYSATAVLRAERAGAVVVGKLNCDAFAHGATGENSDFGPTRNPYSADYSPGGSSSGSGAAVAGNFCVVGTGSDTGGSLRSPASFTNTVAIKPTYGRVSRYGIIAMASSTDSIGHIAHTVEDCARYLAVTAGFDTKDATSSREEVPDYSAGLSKDQADIRGLKIGVPAEYLSGDIDEEIKRVTQNTLLIYESLGAEIVDISLPHTQYALAVYYIVQPSEVSSNLARFDGIRFGKSRAKFGQEAKRRIMIGTHALSSGYYDAYYLKAQKVRTLIASDFVKAFSKVDILLAPVSPVMPPKIGAQSNDPLKNYLMDVLLVGANLAGIPSLALPAGFSTRGLPIGVQIMGKHFDEKTLFRAGHALENNLRLFERKPDF